MPINPYRLSFLRTRTGREKYSLLPLISIPTFSPTPTHQISPLRTSCNFSSGVIVGCAQHVAADADTGLTAKAVVTEAVRHIIRAAGAGVVLRGGQVAGCAVVCVLRLHLLCRSQHRRGFGQPAQDVVLAVHLLAGRVGYFGHGALVGVGDGGHRQASRISHAISLEHRPVPQAPIHIDPFLR